MGALLKQLALCIHTESVNLRPFNENCTPTSNLKRRAKELAKKNMLFALPSPTDPAFVFVKMIAPERSYNPDTNRTKESLHRTSNFGENYARAEWLDQPPEGWSVNVELLHCPCAYWFKFGVCTHLLHSLNILKMTDRNMQQVLVSRRVRRGAGGNRAVNEEQLQVPGRPPLNGFALDRT